MTKNRRLFFLLILFCVSAIAGIILFGLWKLGAGDWTFLASIVCIIVGTAALLYAVARLEKKPAKTSNPRIGFLVYLWLASAGAGLLFGGLWKVGAGEWAESVSAVFFALFVMAPSFWFIIQPDLAITTINALTGTADAPDDWKTLPPIRRAWVYLGTVICWTVGILLLLGVFI